MIGIINKIIELFALALQSIIGILPDSPFNAISFPETGYWGWIGIFVPVEAILTIFGSWLSAVLVWYGVRWVFRFVKYID